jgi:hypothetical protein
MQTDFTYTWFETIIYHEMKTIDNTDEDLEEEISLQLQQQRVEARTM